MSKLKNIKAIQDMLSGTHKSQTRQTHYYGKTSNEILEENIIERDEDGKPKIWIEVDPITNSRTRITQHKGWKSKESESGHLVRKALKQFEMPSECPSCGQNMHGTEKRLNEKFWNWQKKCFDCIVKYETKLRNDPEAWEKYQKEKMYENAKSFFIDADGDMEGLEKMMTEAISGVQNADGDIESYDAGMTKKKFKESVLKEYKKYKKRTLSELKNGKS